MPAKDIYHDAVKQALVNDGWLILAEDYVLEYGGDKLYADIAAEKTLAAERQGQKIIVEVKSFLGRSFINDLEGAVGQYIIYRNILQVYLHLGQENHQRWAVHHLSKYLASTGIRV